MLFLDKYLNNLESFFHSNIFSKTYKVIRHPKIWLTDGSLPAGRRVRLPEVRRGMWNSRHKKTEISLGLSMARPA